MYVLMSILCLFLWRNKKNTSMQGYLGSLIQKSFGACVNSKCPDQTAHLCNLNKVFSCSPIACAVSKDPVHEQ